MFEQTHEQQVSDMLNIHWDIITMCQLNCSYCYARKGYGDQWGKLVNKDTINVVLEALSRSHLNYNLSVVGGEPTLSPYFNYIIEQVDRITKNTDSNLLIISNGEKDITTYPLYDSLHYLWTYHVSESPNEEIFFKNIHHMLSNGIQSKVNIMLHPNKKYWDKLISIFNKCERIEGLKIHPHFIYGNTFHKLRAYKDDFWEFFKFLEEYPKELWYGNSKHNDYTIFKNNLTNFKGWECWNNNIEILASGTVHPFCRDEEVINLKDYPNYFKDITKINPMICPFTNCNCDGLLKQRKTK